MGTLMERVGGEGLAVDELLTRRNDNLVAGRGVVSLRLPYLNLLMLS